MLTKIYLTSAEQKQFSSLSEELKEGWKVTDQEITYKDTPERFKMRLSFLHVHDPKLLAFKEQLQEVEDKASAVALLEAMDLSDVHQPDLAQLFFTLGPDAVTSFIGGMLTSAKNDKDIEGVAALSMIRNQLIKSLALHFAS
ncbi:MAG: hypothetical protein O2904_02085 [bacterium]|nr:hypothetical protein [bacterium]